MTVFALASYGQEPNKSPLPKPKLSYIGSGRYFHPSHPGGYFQYVNVPSWNEYEFGWNRGGPHHYMSRFEQSKDHRFRTRVRWGDKRGGYGEQYWEFNHGPAYHNQVRKHEPKYYITPTPTNIISNETP